MGVRQILGWGLLAWGAIGAYNQFTVYQAAQAGNPSNTSAFNSWEPATVLKIQQGAGLFAAPMLVDLGILGVGAWLAFG
jgi:hypothetical protein